MDSRAYPNSFLWGSVLALSLAGREAHAEPQTARELFEQGLEAVSKGRYVAAKQAFEAAYETTPHFSVLYNLALVSNQLGERDAALRYLARFQAEGGDELSERHKVQAAELEQALGGEQASPGETSDASPGAPVTSSQRSENELAPTPARPAPNAHEWTGQPAKKNATPSSFRLPIPVVSDAHGDAGQGPESSSDAAPGTALVVSLGTAGATLVVGAAGIWLWNKGRHGDWTARNRRLAELAGNPTPSVAQVADYASIKSANDTLGDSIAAVDATALVLGAVGAGCIFGAYYLYEPGNDDSPSPKASAQLRVGPAGVSLFGQF